MYILSLFFIKPKLKCFWQDFDGLGLSGGKKPVLEKFEKEKM